MHVLSFCQVHKTAKFCDVGSSQDCPQGTITTWEAHSFLRLKGHNAFHSFSSPPLTSLQPSQPVSTPPFGFPVLVNNITTHQVVPDKVQGLPRSFLLSHSTHPTQVLWVLSESLPNPLLYFQSRCPSQMAASFS